MSARSPRVHATLSARSVRLAAAAIVLATAGCAADHPPFLVGVPSLRTDTTACQLGERGVRLEVDDVADGVDLTLTTIRDPDDLRQRARDAAAMYGPGAHRGLGHHGKHGDGSHHGLRLSEIRPAVKATEIDVPSGAKIHVAPVDPADVEPVRREVKERAALARWGDCP